MPPPPNPELLAGWAGVCISSAHAALGLREDTHWRGGGWGVDVHLPLPSCSWVSPAAKRIRKPSSPKKVRNSVIPRAKPELKRLASSTF